MGCQGDRVKYESSARDLHESTIRSVLFCNFSYNFFFATLFAGSRIFWYHKGKAYSVHSARVELYWSFEEWLGWKIGVGITILLNCTSALIKVYTDANSISRFIQFTIQLFHFQVTNIQLALGSEIFRITKFVKHIPNFLQHFISHLRLSKILWPVLQQEKFYWSCCIFLAIIKDLSGFLLQRLFDEILITIAICKKKNTIPCS